MLSTGLIATAMPIMAEEAAETGDVEVIEVRGIRGSLIKAQAIKMSSNSIVEVLSAEDIGKLPDTSIAESLARLPGVSGERRNGRTSGLSVRGFNENYVGTSLNGRELLGMGDNRGVEYDLYPTEIVSNVIVYKTPEAGLLVQGIGGTIDLQTISPLNAEKSLTVNANYEKNALDSANPDFDNDGHKIAINYVDQFADDTLGLALVVASQETPRQEENSRIWGYAGVNTALEDDDGNPTRRVTDDVVVPEGTVVPGGHDSFVRSALLKRDSLAAVIEYAPTDDLKFQLDALYIDFEEADTRRGIEEGGAEWGTSAYNVTEVQNGVATQGYYDGFHTVIRNDARSQEAELTTFGLNVEYTINEDWTAELDLSTGEVEKDLVDVESYSGIGRAASLARPGYPDGLPLTARSWTVGSTGVIYSDHPSIAAVDFTNPDTIRLAGPQSWGGSLAPISRYDAAPGSDFGNTTAQDGFVNDTSFDESLDSVRFEVNGLVEYGVVTSIQAGLNYSEREKSKFNDGAYLTAPTWPSDGPIPNPVGVADLGFIGINGVVAYDGLGLYQSGYYDETDAKLIENGRLGDTWTITEDIATAFVKLGLDAEFGDIIMTGNVGLQVVDVEQQGTGFNVSSDSEGFSLAVPVTAGTDYTDVLPTLNLNFEVAEGQFIRTGLSKVISRPRMDDMRPNAVVGFAFNDNQILSTEINNGPWSSSSGNSELKPLEANQFDLSYENYFADDAYFAASIFYKDLTNWHRSGARVRDFTEFYQPGFHATSTGEAPVLFVGGDSFREDGLEGFARGQELQASIPLRLIDDSLKGFGVVLNATFIDGKFDDGSPVQGLSDESYSFTAYYENKGFEVRISGTKRDRFATETRGISLSLVGANDEGAELWDAQIGYDFSESSIEALDGLRVTLQAQNITDETTIQRDANGNITSYQSFGANYLLGLNYKF